jgi:hypothetical protein
MDTDTADIGATAAIMDAVVTTVTADTVTDTGAGTPAGAATAHMAARFTNTEAVMAPMAAKEDSTATPEPDFMALEAVASTVQVVAGFTVVVEAMEADTGN